MTYKIAIICPIILNEPSNISYKELCFYKNTLRSFVNTYDKNQQFMFFIGIYKDNNSINNLETQNELKRFVSVMSNINLEFFYFPKLNLSMVSMWNILAEHAYKNNYDYYINISDNNIFKHTGWIQSAILRLKQNNNLGYVTFIDPTDNKYDTVFCYGKSVKDFNRLEPDKLFILNFSATQEIDKIQQTHINKIETLESKVSTLETELDTYKSIVNKLINATSFKNFKESIA